MLTSVNEINLQIKKHEQILYLIYWLLHQKLWLYFLKFKDKSFQSIVLLKKSSRRRVKEKTKIHKNYKV